MRYSFETSVIPQAIKTTVPYFLGAVDGDHFLRQNELDEARAQLRQLEARQEAMRKTTENALDRIRRFVVDGKRVASIDEEFESADVGLDR